ncbi:MAG: YbaB/EbfC family nucleoid-associated protein [Clostridia bacterium]|nr:YbaB/EbfC family nucleoid-associated protein [Clostridia bacterium]MBR6780117.1 YbaB/EbfC family nucleoid-associated protein [Clostridia bacterium]
MKARIPSQPNRNEMMMRLQKMQEEMQRVQEEVENSEFTASAGGGAVEVTVTGKHEVVKIKMQPDVVDAEDIDMLEDLLLASLNEAIRKANDTMEQSMNSVTGGMNIPGLGGLM